MPVGPLAIASNSTLTATERLEVVRRALEKTEAALRQTPTGRNNELVVETVSRDLALDLTKQALTEIAAGLAHVQTHPATNVLPIAEAPLERSPPRLALLPAFIDRNPAGRFTNPAVVDAFDALNNALGELTNNRPANLTGPVVGDLGGSRSRITALIDQAETAILTGLNASYATTVNAVTN